MFFQSVDLTTALRPSLLPDETLLFVQDAVGIYHGYLHIKQCQYQYLSSRLIELARKYKIPNLQNGHAYLTSHRACYVDNAEPRKHSIAIDLKGIEKYEFYVRRIMWCGNKRLIAVGWISQIIGQDNFLSETPKAKRHTKSSSIKFFSAPSLTVRTQRQPFSFSSRSEPI